LVTLYVWYDPEVRCCTCTKSGAEWIAETGTRKTAEGWVMDEVKAHFPEAL
jgi:hypothetical protein